jgi:rSAM/selenodomain-associated transferase 1
MNAIVIMAKKPEPNKVKTRLISDFNPVLASEIYHGFLLDRIEQIGRFSHWDHFIAYTPESSKQFFERLIPKHFSLIPQRGNDLGERLSNISFSFFNNKYKKMIMIDSDSPNLPSNFIISSFEYLNDSDIVLGPCEDGGYYLVGLRMHIPEIFRDIPWSTPYVTHATKEKAQSVGRTVSLLKKWYDVDTKEDLIRLKNDLDKYSENPNEMYFCKNTHNIISKIDIT